MKTPPGTPPINVFPIFFSPEPNIDLKTKSQPKKLKLIYIIFVAGAVFLEGGLNHPPYKENSSSDKNYVDKFQFFWLTFSF